MREPIADFIGLSLVGPREGRQSAAVPDDVRRGPLVQYAVLRGWASLEEVDRLLALGPDGTDRRG